MAVPINPRVAAIIREIIRIEAGFVDDKDDAGGATNCGVSLRYARSKGLRFDLDGDGDVDVADIRLVQTDDAFDAFLEDFFFGPRINELPEGLQAQVADFAVNSGPGQAIMCLQRVVSQLGYPTAVDGGIGPKTLAAVAGACRKHGVGLVNNRLVWERIEFLHGIVRRKPSQARFIGGWLKRARSYLL